MNYHIRLPEKKDIDALVALCSEHAAYEKAEYSSVGKKEKLIKMLFAENARLKCLIVEIGNEIIGYTTFSIECSSWDADYYTHMDCLFLREKNRGFGIGKTLVNEIIAFSKLHKTNHIEWQTPVFNLRAIQFYNKIGASSKEKIRFTLSL